MAGVLPAGFRVVNNVTGNAFNQGMLQALLHWPFAPGQVFFFGLSAYAILSRKDFSFLSGFIMAGCIVLMCAVVASFFIQISGLQLAISAGFVLFSSAVILYQTSSIIHGGEDNYIMATITLFVSIYNLFLSLLQLLGIFSDD